LNKLTIENFSKLYTQLVNIGIRTAQHVEILIKEVVEKATMQHHFINMYCDLCVQLHEFFTLKPVVEDAKLNFKRLLLTACQTSFEHNLKPPEDLHLMEPEDRIIAEVKYKTRMLGNIRFVGALLARKMLASKVFIAILEELLGDPTPEALESAAALLRTAGPTFDTPDWMHHEALCCVFAQVEGLVQRPKACAPRSRFLLKDVLELRARNWEDIQPKRIEKPTTLSKQAGTAEMQD